MTIVSISSVFIWRRVHSLTGLWLVLYLVQHLVVNSQAALWFGDDGMIFVKFVNFLESLPYLHLLEIFLIGVPLLVHTIWGIKRALDAKINRLPYSRNRAFTWQRLSSWILLVGIIAHVVQMRFVNRPQKTEINNQVRYLNKITFDEGLYTLAPRLGVTLYSEEMISQEIAYSPVREREQNMFQKNEQKQGWVRMLQSYSLKRNEVIAESPSPGVGMLLMVRDTFKSPWIALLYTIFVLAAAFHAFNGFWTFLITWGIILSYRSQKATVPVSVIGMLALSIFGLLAIWGIR